MSALKKKVRQIFRDEVFARDGYQCVFCEVKTNLDAHHITDRNELPAGGYVKENGISLCPDHHLMAELFHQGEEVPNGWFPDDLYKKIGSSREKAQEASERLERRLGRGE